MNDTVRVNGDSGSLAALIAGQRPGFALEAAFYRSAEVYARDVERIFMRCWMVAGHASEIPEPGDYFTLEVAGESVIVVRDEGQSVNAFINVCRHRGSRVCVAPCGKVKTFVCRYHGWTYGLDGALRSRRHMPDDFDRGAYGLKRCAVGLLHGLIFINFDAGADDFDTATADLARCLAPFHLQETQVAEKRVYAVDANWKLAVENFMECYHCAPAHPEYARIHSLKAPAEEARELTEAMLARAEAVGLARERIDTQVPGGTGLAVFYNRHALYPGYKTGSEDGEPLAPLLGCLEDFDSGASDVSVGPLSFLLVYSDHAVIYRFAAREVQKCDMEITWLVKQGAVEGRDYNRDRLAWLWDVTSKADKRIIDHNQAGVNSRFFEPGPFSRMERYTADFVQWYLAAIADTASAGPHC